MADVASVVVPLFGLILLGGLAGQSTVLAKNGRRVVDWLLLRLALPALLFDVLAHAPPGDLGNWPFFLTLTFGTYCAFAISFTVSALRHNGDIRAASIDGAVGSHGSLVYLGPAIVLFAFGPPVAVAMAVILVLDSLLIRLLLPTLWAIGGRERPALGEVLRRVGDLLIDQPMFPAALLGAVLSLIGAGIPAAIEQAVSLLGSAAAPLGLVGLGLALASFRFDGGAGPKRLRWSPAVVIKLVVHPAVVFLLLSWAGNFDPDWMFAAALLGALPPASGIHSMARGSTKPEPMDEAAATGTLASVVTITLLVVLMSERLISTDPFF